MKIRRYSLPRFWPMGAQLGNGPVGDSGTAMRRQVRAQHLYPSDPGQQHLHV